MVFIGIDLGTTFCKISYLNEKTKHLEVLENPENGSKAFPSVVSFDNFNREICYNNDAVNLKYTSDNVLYDSKRFLGRKFKNVKQYFDLTKMTFNLLNENEKPFYKVVNFRDRDFLIPPEVVSGLILNYLKQKANEYLYEKIDGCVITVPAHFTNIERETTLFAAELAGLEVFQLLNEPSAAAIACGYERSLKGKILVFDYGGGTLDISVVEEKSDNNYDVIGYDGDQQLGGRDIDNDIFDYYVKEFNKLGICHDNRKKKEILLEKCEKAKIMFSERNKKVTQIFDSNNTRQMVLTREKLDDICKPHFIKAVKTIEKILNKIKCEKSEINEIVMTGGTSRLPLIQKMVSDFFNGKNPLCYDPSTAIAKGAAIIASKYKNATNFVFNDQLRYSIGLCVKNIDEKYNVKGPDLFRKLISFGTKIPCSIKSENFSTIEDNQSAIRIAIAEGEANFFEGNNFIDEFSLNGIQLRKRGEVRVDIIIDVDKSGLIKVTAIEKDTKKSESKEMKRQGNFYKGKEKDEIRSLFRKLLQ